MFDLPRRSVCAAISVVYGERLTLTKRAPVLIVISIARITSNRETATMLAQYSIRAKITAVVAFLLLALTGMDCWRSRTAVAQREHGGHQHQLAAERPRARRFTASIITYRNVILVQL